VGVAQVIGAVVDNFFNHPGQLRPEMGQCLDTDLARRIFFVVSGIHSFGLRVEHIGKMMHNLKIGSLGSLVKGADRQAGRLSDRDAGAHCSFLASLLSSLLAKINP
jgi:hypothetical protein